MALPAAPPDLAACRTVHLRILHTEYVTPPAPEAPFYLITTGLDAEPRTPRWVFCTRDEDVYQQALDAEGTAGRFTARWVSRRRSTGRLIHVLEGLEREA